MSDDAKISELNETFSLDSLDWFTILDQSALPPDGDNAKITAANVRNYMSYISQGQATDLTDAGESNLHYHAKGAETFELIGVNPTLDTDTASSLVLALAGTSSFSFRNSIGGHALLNIRFGTGSPPTCIIVGADAPTSYTGLLAAVSYGTIFIRTTNTGPNTSNVFSKGQAGGTDSWVAH